MKEIESSLTSTFTDFINYIEFFDSLNGIAMGDAIHDSITAPVILKTSDGGLNWEERTQVVKHLVDLGFAGQVTLSHDFGGPRPALPEVLEMRKAYNPDGYCFVVRRVLPRLRALGISEEDIHTMTVDAPRRLFGGE